MNDRVLKDAVAALTKSTTLPIIQLGHGSGGRLSRDLIRTLFMSAFANPQLGKEDDQAILEINGTRLSFSTDSFVVDPIFFPGGNIGDLAVNGTINDVCMCGATPLYISAGFIIEEGFPLNELKTIAQSMKTAASNAGVTIVTGDTKVVPKGKCDKVFINTSGIGLIEHQFKIGADQLQADDVVIISGGIAEHGIAVLSRREGISFDTVIKSDTTALNSLVAAIIETGGESVHAMRDPTRGGLAASLNELADKSTVGIIVDEQAIPVHSAVSGACEILGLDPFYVANEGKLVAFVAPIKAQPVLEVMRKHPLGHNAAIIGLVKETKAGQVVVRTAIGGQRILDMPLAEQLPRIC